MRCDRCYEKHKKCDKELPTCSSCKNIGSECTRNRVLKVKGNILNYRVYFKDLPNINQKEIKIHSSNVSKALSSEDENSKKVAHNKTLNSDLTTLKNKSYKYTPATLNSDVTLVYQLRNWVLKFKQAKVDVMLMRCCGISFNITSKNDAFFIHNVQNKLFLPVQNSVHEVSYNDSHSMDSLIELATKAYFYNINYFFPLFTYESYCKKPRSLLLKYSVYLSGLHCLPSSPWKTYFFNLGERKIRNLLRPSRITFTLETLQAILVIVICGIGTHRTFTTPFLLSLANSIVLSLGLQHQHPRFKANFMNSENIERLLAYRALIKLNSFRIFTDLPQIRPFEFSKQPQLVNIMNSFSSVLRPTKTQSSPTKSLYLNQPLSCKISEICFLISSRCIEHSNYWLCHISNLVKIKGKHKASVSLYPEACHVYKKIQKIYNSGFKDLLIVCKKQKEILYGIIHNSKELSCICGLDKHFQIDELWHELNLRYLFDLLSLLELTFMITVTEKDSKVFLPAGKPGSFSLLILAISSRFINTILKINPEAPFRFYRSFKLLYASRLIMHHLSIAKAMEIPDYNIIQLSEIMLKKIKIQLEEVIQREGFSYHGTIYYKLWSQLAEKYSFKFE